MPNCGEDNVCTIVISGIKISHKTVLCLYVWQIVHIRVKNKSGLSVVHRWF